MLLITGVVVKAQGSPGLAGDTRQECNIDRLLILPLLLALPLQCALPPALIVLVASRLKPQLTASKHPSFHDRSLRLPNTHLIRIKIVRLAIIELSH
jgi:hypothetical protein